MKLNWNKKYTTIAAYCLLVIIAAVLFVVFVFRFESFTQGFSWIGEISAPIICGIAIAYIINPLVMFIENKIFRGLKYNAPPEEGIVMKKIHNTRVGDSAVVRTIEKHSATADKKTRRRRTAARILSIAIAYIIVLAAIAGIIIAIIPSVSQSVVDLSNNMPVYIRNLEDFLNDTFENNPDVTRYISGEFSEINDLLAKVADMVQPMTGDILGSVSSRILNIAMSIIVALKNVLLGFIIALYFLFSKERLLAQGKKIFFAFFKNSTCQKIFGALAKSNKIFTQYIISNLVDAIIIFAAMAVAMTIMGMPYPMLIAVICGVTNLIPFFGPFIGAIPCGLFIVLADPIKVIWFGIFVLILQQVDGNVIKPFLFGETMGLPAIWVLISIIVGGGMFGIPGMLLGAPVFAVIYLLFAEFVAGRLKKKDMPSTTDNYIENIGQYTDEYGKDPPEAADS